MIKLWILIAAQFSLAMEEGDVSKPSTTSPLIKNYTPNPKCFQPVYKNKFVEEEKIKSFQDWCFNLTMVAQCREASFPMTLSHAQSVFKEDFDEISYFMTTFNDGNVLKQPRKYFNERVIKTNGLSFLNFVISFQCVWRDLVKTFDRQNGHNQAKCDYFFKNCDPKLREYFSIFQKLSTVFLHAYNTYAEKNLASIGYLPEIKNDGGTYIGFFSDDNGYLPIALGAHGYLFFQPQLYGQGQYIKDIGYRGFLVAADGTVIRQNGIHIESSHDKTYVQLNYFEGEDSPYAYFCKQFRISVIREEDIGHSSEYQVLPNQQVNLLARYIKNLSLRENTADLNYFEATAKADSENDVLFSNYIYLEMLEKKLLANKNDDALIAAANWVFQQEEIPNKETGEEVLQALSELQENLKDKICANYEAEIRAEQEAVMKRHYLQERQKTAGKRRGQPYKKGRNPKKGVEDSKSKSETLKLEAQKYFHEHLQTSRVSYKKLCKLTNKMIKTVFKEHEEVFKITTVGSHRNIHVEGSGGLTLVKKHGGHSKDHSYSPQYANNYMTKLIQLGMNALDLKA